MSPEQIRRGRLRSLLVDTEPLRLDRDFRLIWVGQLISGFGRQVTIVVLPLLLWQLTRNPLAIGLLGLVQLVPILIFALGGGAVADAVDRRRLLLVTQVLLAATSAALVVLAILPNPPLVGFYVVAFLAAGIGAVDQPTRSSALPRLVPRERLQAAIAVNWLSGQTVAVCGPVLGGFLAATVGAAWAFGFDVVTFMVSIVAVILISPMPPHPDAARPSLRSVAEGLSFARAKRIVLATFVIDLDAMIFGMPSSLVPQLALTVFNVDKIGYDFLNAAPAFGALIGSAVTGWTARVRHPGRGVTISVAVWGVAIVGFGLFTASFPLALLCLAVAGGADVINAVLRALIVQFETPDRLRGRVMSIHTLVVTSGPRLGDAEAAAVAAIAGPQFSVVSGGVLCLIGLAGVLRMFPALMGYESTGRQAPAAEAVPAGAVQQ